jgi:NAD(P)-dependent dehydrogenase (short-subunit alcohol dehydrogenase family)
MSTAQLRSSAKTAKYLSSKVVIVTGASGTLGKEMSLALASVGATVVMAGCNASRLETSKKKILERAGKAGLTISLDNLVPMTLDLDDYSSVDKFCAEVKAKYDKKIFALVNNAGMVPGPTFKTSNYSTEATF